MFPLHDLSCNSATQAYSQYWVPMYTIQSWPRLICLPVNTWDVRSPTIDSPNHSPDESFYWAVSDLRGRPLALALETWVQVHLFTSCITFGSRFKLNKSIYSLCIRDIIRFHLTNPPRQIVRCWMSGNISCLIGNNYSFFLFPSHLCYVWLLGRFYSLSLLVWYQKYFINIKYKFISIL